MAYFISDKRFDLQIIIHVGKENYRKWKGYDGIFVTGSAFDSDDKLFTTELLYEKLSKINTEEDLLSTVQGINGFFAFIIQKGDRLFIAVDQIRSIPIFYGRDDNNFYVSDKAEWIRTKIGDDKFDSVCEQEFIMSGYVTGSDTLFPSVKQLQAGECLTFRTKGNDLNFNKFFYFRFTHEEPQSSSDENDLINQLDLEWNGAVNRLVQYANGRQIVIPLSAGYDSRAIAIMLKTYGYKHVLCFSYGIKNNFEAEKSKVIADSLGFDWEYVEYSEEKWRNWWKTEERKKYFDMASNWASLAHTQDWAAVWELKKKGVININAVFVPGHTGLICGGHTPPEAIRKMKQNENVLVKRLFNSHYNLVKHCKVGVNTKYYWLDRIKKNIICQTVIDNYKYADIFQEWEYRERQAKFIVNSIRVYEFWGFDWWLPLCDYKFIKYWQRIPLKLRINKALFKRYINTKYVLVTGNREKNVENDRSRTVPLLTGHFTKKMIKFIIKCLFEKSQLPGADNPNAPYGKYDQKIVNKYKKVVKSPTGLGILQFINENIHFSIFLRK